jgi:hypothetical protein
MNLISKTSLFRDITPYSSPLKANRLSGGTCRLHLQGRRISQARNQREARRKQSKLTTTNYTSFKYHISRGAIRKCRTKLRWCEVWSGLWHSETADHVNIHRIMSDGVKQAGHNGRDVCGIYCLLQLECWDPTRSTGVCRHFASFIGGSLETDWSPFKESYQMSVKQDFGKRWARDSEWLCWWRPAADCHTKPGKPRTALTCLAVQE